MLTYFAIAHESIVPWRRAAWWLWWCGAPLLWIPSLGAGTCIWTAVCHEGSPKVTETVRVLLGIVSAQVPRCRRTSETHQYAEPSSGLCGHMTVVWCKINWRDSYVWLLELSADMWHVGSAGCPTMQRFMWYRSSRRAASWLDETVMWDALTPFVLIFYLPLCLWLVYHRRTYET